MKGPVLSLLVIPLPFAVGCTTNLLEHEAYVALTEAYTNARAEYEQLKAEHASIEAEHSGLMERDANKAAASEEARAIIEQHKELVQEHKDAIAAHDETLNEMEAYIQKVANGEVTSAEDLIATKERFETEIQSRKEQQAKFKSDHEKLISEHDELAKLGAAADTSDEEAPTKGKRKGKKKGRRKGKRNKKKR